MNGRFEGGILFDLDGVVYNASAAIPGAAEALRWIKERGIPHLFVTNTTSRPRPAIARKLGEFGVTAGEEEILTPSVAAAQWLKARDGGGVALFVRPDTKAEFGGLRCLEDEAERGADYVVIGDLGELWDYRTLNRAFRLLHDNPDAVLMALGMTRYWMTDDGVSLDVAPFVAALEHASGRKAQVFGKPAAEFFQAAARRLGLPAEQIIMVGDDVLTDVAGAQAVGMKGVLVKTGKFRDGDLEGAVRPDGVIGSIADLPSYLRLGFGS